MGKEMEKIAIEKINEKIKKKKTLYKPLAAGAMALVMALMSVLSAFVPGMTANAAGKTLIVHYGGREDGNYDGWNLWVWEEGREGAQLDFTDTDEFGQVAVYQTSRKPAKIGFIVRLNGWEAKDVEEDRFVTMDKDVVEIWLTSNDPEIKTTAPDNAAPYDIEAMEAARLDVYNEPDALKLNVHYYNFAQSYKADSLEAYVWMDSGVLGSYPLSETDDFGAFIKVGIKNTDKLNTAGIRITENGDESASLEYTVDLTKAQDNEINVYIVEGNPNMWYDINDVVYEPVIADAYFSETSSAQICMTLSRAATDMDTLAKSVVISDEEGNTYGVLSAESSDNRTVLINLEEELKLSKAYRADIEGYQGANIAMSRILGSAYFDEEMAYQGDDLGAVYTKEKTSFKVWAPTATEVALNLYEKGDGDNLIESIPMTAADKGIWECEKTGDLDGVYYTYTVRIGSVSNEVVDLYARTTGVNGDRGMVVDLAKTNPEGFENDVRPEFKNPTDAIIYEVHVRDLSSDEASGITNKGKFLGFTEKGTKNSNNDATGIDHIKELGVTHVQILPMYDYATVDETKLDTPQFNWGYDPKNYNVPEGSYSTDPYNGEVRVREMKQMIQALHAEGLRVNMDVVFNHTYSAKDSWFQKTVPDYYYRKSGESFTNGSGCGNETASERAMMRKYIVDSVVYWAKEYHIDGFRFDLMAVHDMDTMREVRKALDEIDPSIMVYGEGWTGGESGLAASRQTLKASIYQVEGVGAFSDDIRDGIKGNVFDSLDKGFVSGKDGLEESIKFGVTGATPHPQVMVSKNDKGTRSWAGAPGQSINYASCHDNLTLWDKLAISNEDDSEEDRIKMNKLSAAIVLTAQGVPFMQAGEEMLRSKPSAAVEGGFDENSYASPDSTNSIRWDNLSNRKDVYEYYKGLIAFRKAHPALRMTTAADIQNNLMFMSGLDANVVGYTISNGANGDTAQKIIVIYNGNNKAVDVTLPEGVWNVCVNAESAGTVSVSKAEGSVSVAPISAMALVQGDDTIKEADTTNDSDKSDAPANDNGTGEQKTFNKTAGIVAGIAAIIAAGVAAVFVSRRKK